MFSNSNIHCKRVPEALVLYQPNHTPCLCFRFGISCNHTAMLFWLSFIKFDDHEYDGVKFTEPPVGLIMHRPPCEHCTDDGFDVSDCGSRYSCLRISE